MERGGVDEEVDDEQVVKGGAVKRSGSKILSERNADKNKRRQGG